MSTGGASAQVWLIASFDLNTSSCSDSALVVLYCDCYLELLLSSPSVSVFCYPVSSATSPFYSQSVSYVSRSVALSSHYSEGKRRSQLFPILLSSSANIVRVSRCSLLHSRCHGELLSYFCGALFSCDALSATQEVVNNLSPKTNQKPPRHNDIRLTLFKHILSTRFSGSQSGRGLSSAYLIKTFLQRNQSE